MECFDKVLAGDERDVALQKAAYRTFQKYERVASDRAGGDSSIRLQVGLTTETSDDVYIPDKNWFGLGLDGSLLILAVVGEAELREYAAHLGYDLVPRPAQKAAESMQTADLPPAAMTQ